MLCRWVGGPSKRVCGSCFDKVSSCACQRLTAYESCSPTTSHGRQVEVRGPYPSLQPATATAEQRSSCKQTVVVSARTILGSSTACRLGYHAKIPPGCNHLLTHTLCAVCFVCCCCFATCRKPTRQALLWWSRAHRIRQRRMSRPCASTA